VCIIAFNVQAEPIHRSLTDTWQFNVGILGQQGDATLRSTQEGDPRTDIALDDSQTTAQVGVRWRFKDKWAFNLMYSDFNMSSVETRDRSFNYDGVTYPLNSSLDLDVDVALYVASVDYAFSQSDTTEWGIGLGIHGIDLAADIQASLNGVSLLSSGEDFLAPLPNVRLYGRHAFNSKVLGSISAGWMGANIDQFSGSLVVAGASLSYQFADRWSIGINYQLTDIDLEVDDDISEDEYQVELDGFALHLRYGIP
jgi:hypothetical protein